MCRDHANQHSIVPILSDDPRRELPSQHFIDIRQLGWFETMFGLPKNFPRRKITQALANKKLSVTQRILLTFVLHEVSAQTLSEEETALQIALRPLIINKDGHFVAAVISMYQSLLEGKTDCPISGVFGAGKTLSAAAMIAGLLVMDPSLTIMIVKRKCCCPCLREALPPTRAPCIDQLLSGSTCWLCGNEERAS